MSKLLNTIVLLGSLIGFPLSVLPQAAFVPGDVLVMLRPGTSAEALARDLGDVHGTAAAVRVVQEVSAPMRTWLFQFDAAALSQEAMVRAFWAHPGVQMAQNNHVIKERNTPDDPQFGQQWWHQNIASEAAWDITTGGVTATGDTIVVAIIERALLTHPDLAANAWTNHGEIPGNGIDDDGNGYVDDVRGWNPVSQDDAVYGGSHGTQVAGMIGAVGNNGNQVVGANWQVKMMPVHYQNAQESNVIAAYTYPLEMRRLYNSTGGDQGAFIVATNASWGVDGGQPSNAPIWCAMYDTLGTAGILNCGSTTNNNSNVDVVGDLPTACPSDYMISVTATNSNDVRTFSGYGATTVDLGAPGDDVRTTTSNGGTGTTSGTSFASPLTAGVIALMYSVPCPSLGALAGSDPQEAANRVRQALFDGVDQAGNLPGNTVTGGRINAANSVQLLMDNCEECPAPYNMAVTSDAIGAGTLSWSAMPGTYSVRYRAQGTTTWTETTNLTGMSLDLTGLTACQAYEFQMAADCGDGDGAYGPTFTWTSEGCCTAPLAITAEAIDTTSATVGWTTVLASNNYDLRFREVGTTSWAQLDDLTGSNTTLTGLTPCTELEVQMRSTCGGTDAPWSSSVLLHVPGCGQCSEGDFCTSQGSNTSYEWIARVKLNDIDRSSQSDGGYADVDVTGQSTPLTIGAPYPILLAQGYSGWSFEEFFTVWIDLDRDGIFSVDELLFSQNTSSTTPITGTLTVPAGTLPGQARLRVVMKDNAPAPTGCTQFQYGETEDYCVTLVDLSSGIADAAPMLPVDLFPQPADQLLHFTLPAHGQWDLEVMDMTGRTVLQQPIGGGTSTVSTAQLGTGMYLYRITGNGGQLARGNFMVAH